MLCGNATVAAGGHICFTVLLQARRRAQVTRRWEHYPYMLDKQEDDAVTNNAGIADFPSRSIKKTSLRKIWDVILNLNGGVHSSWGLSATIDVDAEGYQGRTYLQIISEHVQLFLTLEKGETADVELGKTPADRVR